MSSSILYKVVRTYNLLLAIIPAIAFYRATVQPEYKWGLLVINGIGRSTDYWFLILFLFFAWTTFALEIVYKRKWYYLFPIVLFAIVFFVLLIGYLSNTNMVFQGDVWKFKFELGLVFVLISLALLLISIFWTIYDSKNFLKSTYIFSKNAFLNLGITAIFSIVILLLFTQGKGGLHTYKDGIAVALVVMQALYLSNIIDKSKVVKN